MARATALAIAALLTYGINSFFFKIATLYEVSVPAYTVATSFTFGALSVAAHFSPWKAVRLRVNRVVLRYGLISGFIIGVAFNAMIWSLRLGGEASVVIPIFQLSFVLTAALGIIRLNEPMTPRKGVGFGLWPLEPLSSWHCERPSVNRHLLISVFCQIAVGGLFLNLAPVTSNIVREFGVSYADVGLLTTSFIVGQALISIAGRISFRPLRRETDLSDRESLRGIRRPPAGSFDEHGPDHHSPLLSWAW